MTFRLIWTNITHTCRKTDVGKIQLESVDISDGYGTKFKEACSDFCTGWAKEKSHISQSIVTYYGTWRGPSAVDSSERTCHGCHAGV